MLEGTACLPQRHHKAFCLADDVLSSLTTFAEHVIHLPLNFSRAKGRFALNSSMPNREPSFAVQLAERAP